MRKLWWIVLIVSCGCKNIPIEHRVRILYNQGNSFATYEMRIKNEVLQNDD